MYRKKKKSFIIKQTNASRLANLRKRDRGRFCKFEREASSLLLAGGLVI